VFGKVTNIVILSDFRERRKINKLFTDLGSVRIVDVCMYVNKSRYLLPTIIVKQLSQGRKGEILKGSSSREQVPLCEDLYTMNRTDCATYNNRKTSLAPFK